MNNSAVFLWFKRFRTGLVLFIAINLIFTPLVASIHPPTALAATPIINVQPTALNADSVTISWTTNTSQDSKVEYGSTSSYGSSQTNAAVTTNHSVTLSGLIPGTTYHYRVGDIAGTNQSEDYTVVLPYEFGIITNDPQEDVSDSHLSDEFDKGIRYKTLDLAWDRYETADDTFSSSYIADKLAELEAYRSAGFEVALDAGVHYTPSWVRSLDANSLFKNQFGDTYAPNSPGKNIANFVFNNSVRTKLADYYQQIFADFGTDFSAVRLGGLWFGELHYPAEEYNDRTNTFWGYDANAQGDSSDLPSGVDVNPVPGWIPNPVENGTFENGNDGNWTLGGAMDVIVASDAHRGTHSLKMTNPGSFTNVVQQDIQVVSGRTYRYSAWAKTSDPDTSTPPCLRITTTGGTEIVSPQCAYSTSYQQITGTFTPNVDTVRLHLLTYAAESGVVLTFDDISLLDSDYSYDATNSNATAFWEWYRDSLTNYQNWQIDTVRDAGFTGRLFMLYPGYGLRAEADTDWIAQSISYDLSLTTVANTSGEIQNATDWQTQIEALPDDDSLIFPYTTWLDGTGTDESSDKREWSAAKYLSFVADGSGRGLLGENTGANNYTQMQNYIANITDNDYLGGYWFSEGQLYGGSYATENNYNTEIKELDQTSPYNLNLLLNSGASSTTDSNITLTVSATDNVDDDGGLEMIISQDPNFGGASYQSYSTSRNLSLNSSLGDTVYLKVKDSQGNISNLFQSSITLISNNGGGSNNSNSGPATQNQAPSCNVSAPSQIPDLFQIDTSDRSAKLYFETVSQNVSGYSVSYGYSPNDQRFGVNLAPNSNLWIASANVDLLEPNTTYYFQIRAVNGCNAGSWSPNFKIVTNNTGHGTLTKFYAANSTDTQNQSITGQTITGSCQYTVLPGDSFWKIATKILGSGRNYLQLLNLNLLNPNLRPGMVIRTC